MRRQMPENLYYFYLFIFFAFYLFCQPLISQHFFFFSVARRMYTEDIKKKSWSHGEFPSRNCICWHLQMTCYERMRCWRWTKIVCQSWIVFVLFFCFCSSRHVMTDLVPEEERKTLKQYRSVTSMLSWLICAILPYWLSFKSHLKLLLLVCF